MGWTIVGMSPRRRRGRRPWPTEAISLGRGNYQTLPSPSPNMNADAPVRRDRNQAGSKKDRRLKAERKVLAGANGSSAKHRHGASLREPGWSSAEAEQYDLSSPQPRFRREGLRERGLPSATAILEPPTITKTAMSPSRSVSRLAKARKPHNQWNTK